MFGFKHRRRARLCEKPFPPKWLRILERNVSIYNHLSDKDKTELQNHIRIFLHEKRFEGCGGLEITDEVRVTIAAQACLLLLHRKTDYYPHLKTILVYPSKYASIQKQHIGGGIIVEAPQTRLGESWHRGPVVLSWDDVRHGAYNPDDGRNVTLHEFAHQLDDEDGDTDGAPALPTRSMYKPWAHIMQHEYDALRDDLEKHRKTFIDAYGSTNPAEFFAVITEVFFEKPRQFKQKHPALYNLLKDFYQQDPTSWQ